MQRIVRKDISFGSLIKHVWHTTSSPKSCKACHVKLPAHSQQVLSRSLHTCAPIQRALSLSAHNTLAEYADTSTDHSGVPLWATCSAQWCATMGNLLCTVVCHYEQPALSSAQWCATMGNLLCTVVCHYGQSALCSAQWCATMGNLLCTVVCHYGQPALHSSVPLWATCSAQWCATMGNLH